MEHKEYRKLHAEWYEYMSGGKASSQETDFWANNIRAAGEPVLELGSGTGKVFMPLLERGFDITGIDTSEDMMARCRAMCQAEGLTPQLYEQSMLDFSLPRQFGSVILASGSLSLFTADEDIRSMFGRVMAHLKPGGMFAYGFEHIPENPEANDNNWTGSWVRGPGDVIIAWRNHWRHDAASHLWECLFVVEKFVGGRLIETEANERTGRYFSIDEAVGYAREAGFEEIRVTDEFTEDPPRRDSTDIIVRCGKPVSLPVNASQRGPSMSMTKHYLHEDLCYRDIHRDGKPYYQHEAGHSCDPDLQRLFSWDSFPGKGSEILEIGCGDGFVTAILASRGLSVTGVDCSPTAIHYAQRNLTQAGLTATLHIGDACSLDFVKAGSFRYVLDCHCLHCITDYRDRARFLQACRSVMSPGGRLFLATMSEQPMEWTKTIKQSEWQKERNSAFQVDERGCYVESLVPPEMSQRVNSRIFIREEVLREELDTAGFVITRFERFAPQADPGDMTFLLEVQKKED